MHTPQMPRTDSKLHWWSDPRALLRYVLSLDDTPHHIALGTAVGMFVGLTPTVGIQMLLVLATYAVLSPLLRFNVKAALVTVYISNPLTMLPIYWFDYRVGQILLGGNVTREEFAAILAYDGLAEWWATITTLFLELGGTMCVGALLVGGSGALATYPVMRYLFRMLRGESSKPLETESDQRAEPRVGSGSE